MNVKPLPPGTAGKGKAAVYEALCGLIDREGCATLGANGDVTVWFRKDDLAARAGLSRNSSWITRSLQWLHQEGLIEYRPGNPGRLSSATLQPAETGVRT